MRAANMQALTDAIKRRYPGVVIYGIGNDAHKLHLSDHNEDDTSGSKAAQSDSDSNPEHRAIDVMLGAAFSRADAYALIEDLLGDAASRARLYYIIFDGWIWSRSSGWAKRAHTDDPHRDHPHISGWAADDENTAAWPVGGSSTGGGWMDTLFCKKGDQGETVQFWQVALKQCGFYAGAEDGDYGDGTAKAVGAARKALNSSVTDGLVIDAHAANQILIHFVRHWQTKTPGPAGNDGKDGRDGLLVLPEKVTIEATVKPIG